MARSKWIRENTWGSGHMNHTMDTAVVLYGPTTSESSALLLASVRKRLDVRFRDPA